MRSNFLKIRPLHIRKAVFWPIFGLFIATAAIALVSPVEFVDQINIINQWMLQLFGSVFSLSAILFLGTVIAIYFSPIGKIIIGYGHYKPIFTKAQWLYVTLCTTIATGILFWGAAEPLYHFHNPPNGIGIKAESTDAQYFAMSTLFTHWTFIPYAIYTLVALTFSLKYYNLKSSFSLGALLRTKEIQGIDSSNSPSSKIADSVALFSLIAGMSASLGAGILLLNAGMNLFLDFPPTTVNLGITTLTVVLAFVASSISGLTRGIRWLSDLNAKVFIILALFVLFMGPFSQILRLSMHGLIDFVIHFFDRSLIQIIYPETSSWAQDWTIFYWTNWIAWTPISALFLGRIGVGYSVREFIRFNLLYPALFSLCWMSIFGSISLLIDSKEAAYPLNQILTEVGNGQVIFGILERYPITSFISALFLLTVFVSYVTAADSNTTAMSALSSKEISPTNPEAPRRIKLSWGLLIGLVSWIMIAFSGDGATQGLDGIRILSNLGGLPALLICFTAFFHCIVWLFRGFPPVEKT